VTVGELYDLLGEIDRERTIYVPGEDGKAEILAHVVDLKHVNFGPDMKGIAIPDDVALLPGSIFESTENMLDEEADEEA
jgi:hypothetical protein